MTKTKENGTFLKQSNYCEHCHVHVESSLARCPLCEDTLTDTPDTNTLYPDVTEPQFIDHHTFMYDLFLFVTFVFIAGSILLNFIFWQGTPWFIAVAAPILYTWILVAGTIASDMYAGAKAFFQMAGIMGMMLAFDYVTGWQGWSIEFVLPFVLMGGLIYIDLYSWVHKSYWRDNLVYAILFVVLGFLPLIFYVNGVTTHAAFVPTLLCTITSGLTVLGILRFTIRHIKGEMQKRLHI